MIKSEGRDPSGETFRSDCCHTAIGFSHQDGADGTESQPAACATLESHHSGSMVDQRRVPSARCVECPVEVPRFSKGFQQPARVCTNLPSDTGSRHCIFPSAHFHRQLVADCCEPSPGHGVTMTGRPAVGRPPDQVRSEHLQDGMSCQARAVSACSGRPIRINSAGCVNTSRQTPSQ